MSDESSIGVWFWFWLFLGVNVVWIGMDLWLSKHGHEMLTTEFREGLKNPFVGPFLAFMVAGTVAAFVTHMWSSR